MGEDDAARSLAKAERFAGEAERLEPARFELVIHAAYHAMYHAARAVLIAAEGSATTSHGRLPNAFARRAERVGRVRASGMRGRSSGPTTSAPSRTTAPAARI